MHSIFYYLGGLLLHGSLTHAQSLETVLAELPQCGVGTIDCVLTVLPESPCTASNATCICTNVQFNEMLSECALANCTVEESLTAKNVSSSFCGLPEPNHGNEAFVISIVFGALALFSVALRLAGRWRSPTGQFGLDDAVISLALCFAIPISVLSWYLKKYGMGQNMWTIPFDNITKMLYILYVDEVLYHNAVCLTKISILLFYLRIFPNKPFRVWCHILIGVSFGFEISAMIAHLLHCRPFDVAWKFWDGMHPGTCTNLVAEIWASAIINTLLDLAILVSPMPLIWKLNLSTKKKVGVLLMFSVGLFVTIVSTIRLRTLVVFENTTNPTFDYTGPGIWSTIEVDVGITCSCMPSMRVLFKQLWPAVFGSTIGISGAKDSEHSSGAPKYSNQFDSRERFAKPGLQHEYIEIDPVNNGGRDYPVRATRQYR